MVLALEWDIAPASLNGRTRHHETTFPGVQGTPAVARHVRGRGRGGKFRRPGRQNSRDTGAQGHSWEGDRLTVGG